MRRITEFKGTRSQIAYDKESGTFVSVLFPFNAFDSVNGEHPVPREPATIVPFPEPPKSQMRQHTRKILQKVLRSV
jgi:hypothetical protein